MKLTGRTYSRFNKMSRKTGETGKESPNWGEKGWHSHILTILPHPGYHNIFSSFVSIDLRTHQAHTLAFWTEKQCKLLLAGNKSTLYQGIKHCPIAYMGQSCLLPDINRLHLPRNDIPFHKGNAIMLFVLRKCSQSSASNIWVLTFGWN